MTMDLVELQTCVKILPYFVFHWSLSRPSRALLICNLRKIDNCAAGMVWFWTYIMTPTYVLQGSFETLLRDKICLRLHTVQ